MAELGMVGGSEGVGEESFERLLEESLARSRVRLNQGDRVRGTVLSVGRRDAVVDLGAKREALLDRGEVTMSGEPLSLNVGEEVEGTVVDEGSEGEPARITAQVPGGRLGRQWLAEAKRENRTVTGVVRGYNRGGLEIQIGGVRAFCPMSQVDARPPDDLSVFVGQRLSFKVHDLRGRQVVVSHRSLLDEERNAKAQETLANITEGQTLHGSVASLHDFGAFVDIGGVDALLPTSEVTRRRIAKPSDVLKPGQDLDVQVLKIDLGEGRRRPRVTVSLKALETDPWEAAREWLLEGAAFRGKVVGIQPFGVFVELVPGVDGLIHVSDLAGGRHVEHPEEIVSPGQEIDVLVGPVDWENRRVSLSPLVPIAERAPEETTGGSFGTTIGEALKDRQGRQ
ncbi:MAG: S1 RNA-binding domain-containing protein [Deltaproteobacteria bacterium]|nr:S1 RNA-binding domain-containing protein [Deltaproteobacteria bacterium]